MIIQTLRWDLQQHHYYLFNLLCYMFAFPRSIGQVEYEIINFCLIIAYVIEDSFDLSEAATFFVRHFASAPVLYQHSVVGCSYSDTSIRISRLLFLHFLMQSCRCSRSMLIQIIKYTQILFTLLLAHLDAIMKLCFNWQHVKSK